MRSRETCSREIDLEPPNLTKSLQLRRFRRDRRRGWRFRTSGPRSAPSSSGWTPTRGRRAAGRTSPPASRSRTAPASTSGSGDWSSTSSRLRHVKQSSTCLATDSKVLLKNPLKLLKMLLWLLNALSKSSTLALLSLSAMKLMKFNTIVIQL